MKCIVAGASGLVGAELLTHLLADARFTAVNLVARRPSPEKHSKMYEQLISFDDLPNLQLPQADVAFCCLGTTIKKAGSKEAFKKVDHEYIVAFAQACARAGVRTFVLVSALGAQAQSAIFYNRVKGQTEDDIQKIGFLRLVVLRPSLLLGKRHESRPVEYFAQVISRSLTPLMIGPLARSRPIEAHQVAVRMIAEGLKEQRGSFVILNHEI